jgi:hypothetical protein
MYSGNPITASLSIVIYLTFIAVAILINLVPLSTQFGGPLALPNVHNLATAFFSLSAGLNALVSILIAAKLLYFWRLTAMYVSIVAIIIESVALYTTCSVVFVILDHLRSPAGFWFGAVVNCSAVRALFKANTQRTHRQTVPQPRLDHTARCDWVQRYRWRGNYVHPEGE